jgi:hypothetical protein
MFSVKWVLTKIVPKSGFLNVAADNIPIGHLVGAWGQAPAGVSAPQWRQAA